MKSLVIATTDKGPFIREPSVEDQLALDVERQMRDSQSNVIIYAVNDVRATLNKSQVVYVIVGPEDDQ